MRLGPQTRALWEMFSDLTFLDDAHQYAVGMDVRYALGDDPPVRRHPVPGHELTLERRAPDIVTAVTWSADMLREGRGLLLDLVGRPDCPRCRGRVDRTGQRRKPPARTGWTSTRCSFGPTASSPGPSPPGGTSTPPRWCLR